MRKRRAIVIHDDAGVVNKLSDFFSSRDYEVVAFSEPGICPLYTHQSGRCHHQLPCADIIISDYALPRISGLNLFETQLNRGCGLTSKNKAIITSPLDDDIREQITSQGFAYFQNPFDLQALTAWVNECEHRMDLTNPLGSRRLGMRHETRHEIQCTVDALRETVKAMVVNVSDKGLCVKLPFRLRRWQTIQIDTSLPVIACHRATVRWVAKNNEGTYDTGLRCN